MEENTEVKSGNPYWLLLSVPIFFLVWKFVGVVYAFILGPGSLVLLYVVFVWLPDDKVRKLGRKAMFQRSRKVLAMLERNLSSVRDRKVLSEVQKSLPVFREMIDSMETKKMSQGLTEEKVLPTVESMYKLLAKWIKHESGLVPMENEEADRVRGVLLKFDDLARKYQSDGASPDDQVLTELFMTESSMQSVGIDPTEK